MLPNLRLVIVATISTFMLTVWAGLYASVRLTHEPLTTRTEKALVDETPVDRISMTWPLLERSKPAASQDSVSTLKPGEEALAPPAPSQPAPQNPAALPDASPRTAARTETPEPGAATEAPKRNSAAPSKKKTAAQPHYARGRTAIRIGDDSPNAGGFNGSFGNYYMDYPSRPQ